MEPNDFSYIIQPVLQFGSSPAGGGASWAIASWLVVNGGYYVSDLLSIRGGNTFSMAMTIGSCIDTGCDYSATGWNASTSTTLDVNLANPPTVAFAALEVYNVSSCDSYPWPVQFQNIVLDEPGPSLLDFNQLLTISWGGNVASPISPSCGFGVAADPAGDYVRLNTFP
jgi:hypothetical protein